MSAAVSAGADQLEMTLRAVDGFTSEAQLTSRPYDRLPTLARRVMEDHRLRMAVWPVEEDGVLGGLDGAATAGNNDATYLAPRPSPFLPVYDPHDPGQQNVPMIVPGWDPNQRWIVRAPDSIENVLGQFLVPRGTPCFFPYDCGRHDVHRKHERVSLLALTRGQFLLVVPACFHCRKHHDLEYGAGRLNWLDVSSAGRISVQR